MKKTLLFVVLLVVVAGAAAAGYFFYLRPQAQLTAYTTEGALPSAPDAEYTVALKLTDMGSLKSVITGTSSLIADIQPLLASKIPQNAAEGIVSSLNGLNTLLDTVSEMSILAAPRQSSHEVYISLLADGAEFSRVMAEMSSEFYTVEKWDAGIADSEGWSVKNPNGFAIYVLKRDGAERSQVLAAGAEEAISSMI